MVTEDKSDLEKSQSSLMHDRAREAGSELRRAVIALSTGSIAMLFLALTSEVNPPLDVFEKICATGTVLAHAIAALSGLCAWRADAERNFHWGHALRHDKGSAKREHAESMRKNRQAAMKIFDTTSRS